MRLSLVASGRAGRGSRVQPRRAHVQLLRAARPKSGFQRFDERFRRFRGHMGVSLNRGLPQNGGWFPFNTTKKRVPQKRITHVRWFPRFRGMRFDPNRQFLEADLGVTRWVSFMIIS